MADELLERLLISRGLAAPNSKPDDAILANEEMLARIAGMFKTYEKEIIALVDSRLTPIKHALIFECAPAETMVLRQALLEVASIYDDAKKYNDEYDKRERERKEAEGASRVTLGVAQPEAAPKLEDNVRKDNGDLSSV